MGLHSASVTPRIEDAKRHGLLHLAQCNLVQCPSTVFSLPSLVRLDLSGNLLATLPDAIRSLKSLQFLWVSENPKLTTLPLALSSCSQLRVLDARSTALVSLSCQLARLTELRVLDIGETPLETRWLEKRHLTQVGASKSPFASDAQRERYLQIQRKLQRKDERTRLKKELFDKLHDDLYRVERSDSAGDACLRQTIQRLLKPFPVADEIRSVIRNAERLFPSLAVGASLVVALEKLEATAFRAAFDSLRTDNERKKRAADLELKIRALYFDRIDPSTVEGIVQSIYREVAALGDVNFLIKHAAMLFPKEPKDVDGKTIYARLVALQEELARERQAATDKLRAAVKAIYIDTELDQVQALVASIAVLFKKTKDLRSLAADASALFPAEFLNAQPSEIRAAFLRQKAETLGGGSTLTATPSTVGQKTRS